MTVAVRSNLRVLHSQKEAAEARRIPYREIAENIGVAESTISGYMNDKVQYFDRDTLDKLCSYYECNPGDLIIRIANGNRSKLKSVAN